MSGWTLRTVCFQCWLLLTLLPAFTGAAQPDITTPPTNQAVAVGGTASFSVAADGAGPFTYQWLFNGNIVTLIATAAGNRSAGFSGDGNAATNAALYYPAGAAVDEGGNLFIADTSNNRIRKVDVNGIITTVAGNGSDGFSGDGNAATNAALSRPQGVAVDKGGNLFIADTYNQRIRKVDVNGIITTVVGNGSASFSGDGNAATNAALNYPAGVAVDNGGNLFIADSSNHRIRKVDVNGIIATAAGNGSASFSGDGNAATNAALNYPGGVAVDNGGNLFIADSLIQRIRKVDVNGIITTVAGNGSAGFSGDGNAAINAALYYPGGVAVDNAGNLFITDSSNNRIRKVDVNGIISTAAGNGSAGFSGDGNGAANAALYYPFGVGLDNGGNLFIADTYNHRVRKVMHANLSTLTLANITLYNIGNYSVIVSNSSGSVTSSVAALNMLPYITVQPANRTTAATGSSPSFSVAAAGSMPLGYQWYYAGTNLLQSGPDTTLTLSDVSTNNSGIYTVVVTNAYGSVTSQVASLVVEAPAMLTHRYSFDTNANDLVGSANGTILGNAYVTNGSLVLDGTNGSVQLPNNLFTNYDSLSLEIWFVDAPINNQNAQLYSFSGTNGAITYSLYGQGAYVRRGVSSVVNLPSPAVGRTNHLVWRQDSGSALASLYVNGILAGANTSFTNTPSLIGSTTTNRIGAGKTNSTALNFKGSILEFRTYQGALSPLEVAVLDAFGPDLPQTSAGALQAVRMVIPSPTGPGALFRAGVFADFSSLTNINISAQPDLVLSSDNPNVIAITPDQQLKTMTLGTANITAIWHGFSNTVAVTVGVPQDIALLHRYGFNERTNDWVVHDSVGGANGQLFNTGSHFPANGVFTGTGQMKLSGGTSLADSGGYAALPPGVVSSLSEVTLEAWVTWIPGFVLQYGNGAWQRIFDFGGGTNSYLYLTPATVSRTWTHTTITTNGPIHETPILDWMHIFPTNVMSHVAVTYSPVRGVMKLYLNGVLVASGIATIPLSGIVDTNNWLGRSQFSGDAYFYGSYNEFRIYSGLLSDADVAADFAAGPDAVGVDYILHSYWSGSALSITWGLSATNLVLQSTPVLGDAANWNPVPVTPVLQNGRYAVTVPLTGAAAYFRLHAP